MYYTSSNPTPERLSGLMNYLVEVKPESEDITQKERKWNKINLGKNPHKTLK